MTQTINQEQFAQVDPAVLAWSEAFAARQQQEEATAQTIGSLLIDAA